jgi:uncharacterized protein DUF5319
MSRTTGLRIELFAVGEIQQVAALMVRTPAIAAPGRHHAAFEGVRRYRGGVHDEPIDPFAGDPADPSNELADLDEAESEDGSDPLTPAEREDVLEDLADLEIYQALLTPVGVRGLVIECEDCHEPHYFDWDLLRGNLRHLLDSGRPRVHEPAYDPDPDHYVTWEYARGYADGVHDTLTENGD